MSRLVLTRRVPESIAAGERTYLEQAPIDLQRARAQHHAYEALLTSLGGRVEHLPPLDALPDSVFVEDAAVVLPEVAILTRPGAPSRRPEVPSVRDRLALERALVDISEPGTLDGGDVLVVGRRVFVGRSTRSNDAAIAQLAGALSPFGYSVEAVATDRCLHLKSAATALSDDRLLVSPALVDPAAFGGLAWLAVDDAEPHAANVVPMGGVLIHSASWPRTAEILRRAGYDVAPIEVDELEKAEAAVTCCSLLVG